MPPTPHDALFKATFSQVAHARAMLRDRLPPRLARAVDWQTLRRRPGSFVDEKLRERHTDLLFTARIRNRTGYFYLLFEHQSTADRWMLLRLLEYILRIWWDHLTRHPRARKLPAVVPVVLHHSEHGWSFATELSALLDVEDDVWPDVAPFVPQFRCVLDDISLARDEELRARAITALGKLVLGCFRHGRDIRELLQGFGAWVATFAEVRRSRHGLRAWALVLRYILEAAHDLDTEEVRALVARSASPEIAEDIVTLAEKLREEGRKEGRTKGREEGIQKGRIDRSRELVQMQLRLKFGKLPAAAAARVRTASEADLDRWAKRVLTAASLADVLDG